MSALSSDPEVMNVAQAAAFLGCSRNTLYQYVRLQGLPKSKRGGRTYFLRSSLIAWIEQGEQVRVRR